MPGLDEGEVLLKVEASGLFPWDLRALPEGVRASALVGRGVAGTVAKAAPGVADFKKGDRVFVPLHAPCLECHHCRRQSWSTCVDAWKEHLEPAGLAPSMRVPARHVRTAMLSLPKKIAFAEATLLEPLAGCVNAFRKAGTREGDCAVVAGLGILGLLAARELTRMGVVVVGVDPEPGFVRQAQKLGLEHAYTGRDGRLQDLVFGITGGRGADLLFAAAGDAPGLALKLAWVRDGGSVCLADFPPAKPEPSFGLGELSRRSIAVFGGLCAGPEDLSEARRRVASGETRLGPFVKHDFPIGAYAEAVRRLLGREIANAVLMPQKPA